MRNSRQSTRALNTNSKAWKQLRLQVLMRDKYQCRYCKRVVIGKDAHVDHIGNDAHLPESNRLDNLATMCRQGHGRKTFAEEQGKKWDGQCRQQATGADGWPCDSA